MPRKWTEAHLQVAQEHLRQREDKREERLRKDEEERQESLRKTGDLNQKRLVAPSKRKKSKAIRRQQAKAEALAGLFEGAVQKLHQSLEGNKSRNGGSEIERVADVFLEGGISKGILNGNPLFLLTIEQTLA